MDIFVKQKDNTIYKPGYAYLGEQTILDEAVLPQKLCGVYNNHEFYYYFCPGMFGGTMIDEKYNETPFSIDSDSNMIKFEDSQYAYGLYTIEDDNIKIKLVDKYGTILNFNRIDVDDDFFRNNKPSDSMYSYEFLQKYLNKEVY